MEFSCKDLPRVKCVVIPKLPQNFPSFGAGIFHQGVEYFEVRGAFCSDLMVDVGCQDLMDFCPSVPEASGFEARRSLKSLTVNQPLAGFTLPRISAPVICGSKSVSDAVEERDKSTVVLNLHESRTACSNTPAFNGSIARVAAVRVIKDGPKR